MSTLAFFDATARQRVAALLDPGTFRELLHPAQRVASPHLEALGLPVALDDGLVAGVGLLGGRTVLCAAQEPKFMGGSVGEVHGAKLTGLLHRAVQTRPDAVVLLLDTGGVRLHEANAGLIAISEIQRAVFAARQAGIPVIVVSAGTNGCYGGLGIVARSCDWIVMTEEGRLSVSGPEVIESQKGVEEFDARDRALVWRTMGGKHRYLIGEADLLCFDSADAIRDAVSSCIGRSRPLSMEAVLAEHQMLADRLEKFGAAADAIDIWTKMGVPDPQAVPGLEVSEFLETTRDLRKSANA